MSVSELDALGLFNRALEVRGDVVCEKISASRRNGRVLNDVVLVAGNVDQPCAKVKQDDAELFLRLGEAACSACPGLQHQPVDVDSSPPYACEQILNHAVRADRQVRIGAQHLALVSHRRFIDRRVIRSDRVHLQDVGDDLVVRRVAVLLAVEGECKLLGLFHVGLGDLAILNDHPALLVDRVQPLAGERHVDARNRFNPGDFLGFLERIADGGHCELDVLHAPLPDALGRHLAETDKTQPTVFAHRSNRYGNLA